jgi:hypothetical protein
VTCNSLHLPALGRRWRAYVRVQGVGDRPAPGRRTPLPPGLAAALTAPAVVDAWLARGGALEPEDAARQPVAQVEEQVAPASGEVPVVARLEGGPAGSFLVTLEQGGRVVARVRWAWSPGAREPG